MSTLILAGDCVESMSFLADRSVHCCVTSPPYFGLRDYGVEGQIGLEATPDAYVAQMVEVFREVRRVLRDDGTLWLNLGDSYANDGKWGGHTGGKHAKAIHCSPIGRNKRYTGLKPKDLIGIPWRVAFALQADGWYLRQDIIWHKPNPMPESVRDRCTKAHEYIFLLSKSPKYYYDAPAIAEKAVTNDLRRPYGSPGANAMDPRGAQGAGKPRGKTWDERKAMGFRGDTKPPTKDAIESGLAIPSFATAKWGRNRRSVWTVTTKPFKGAHFATFPPDLIEPCILAGSPAGGIVLDPFGGAGTTGLVANKHGRSAILCELNPAYAEMARARIGTAKIR